MKHGYKHKTQTNICFLFLGYSALLSLFEIFYNHQHQHFFMFKEYNSEADVQAKTLRPTI